MTRLLLHYGWMLWWVVSMGIVVFIIVKAGKIRN